MVSYRRAFSTLAAFTLVLGTVAGAAGPIQSPSELLGIQIGADRVLADYNQIVRYFRALDEASDRVELVSLGSTTRGNDMIMAVISSPANLANKARLQEIARRLADPRGLAPDQVEALVHEGKVIVLVTCAIHASEIASTQMAMEWAHALATASDPETLRRLDQAILLLVPSLNPDGQLMEVDWYRGHLGTPYEGGRMPWLYHHYVGHDTNRDWYMLTQHETRAMSRAVYHEWLPQVWLDEHQMGNAGPRMFVPPYANPASPRVHPLIWRTVDHIGSLMSWRLEAAGKAGVAWGYQFDAYWPGGTKNTAWFKNIAGLLTEVASVRLATPVEVAPTDLKGGSKGLVDYRQQVNFPSPWSGGTWRLRDIMDYERIASDALLELCATRREDLLRDRAKMALDTVARGSAGRHWRIGPDQHDPGAAARLAHLLAEHGVDVLLDEVSGAVLVPTAQPYGSFVAEMLGTQRYPEVRPAPGSDILPPYDVAAWSLPLMMGVTVDTVDLPEAVRSRLRPLADRDWPAGSILGSAARPAALALRPETNDGTRLLNELLRSGGMVEVASSEFTADGLRFPAGTALLAPLDGLGQLAERHHVVLTALASRPAVAAARLSQSQIGLYSPWGGSMDEGWTRWVLEQHGFTPRHLDPAKVKAGKLRATFDIVVLPSVGKDTIVEGKRQHEEGEMRYVAELPPEYSGGIGSEGVARLVEFVTQGGTLVALGQSVELVLAELNVPVGNALARVKPTELACPGSLLRVEVDSSHPVTWGMPRQAAAFVEDRLAFETVVPGNELRRWVLASYPADEQDILLSGWIRGAEKLERRAAAVALTYGKGKIVLLGFRVQYRGQTEGTYKLLFGALRWAAMS